MAASSFISTKDKKKTANNGNASKQKKQHKPL
jgi:hypothetical protein